MEKSESGGLSRRQVMAGLAAGAVAVTAGKMLPRKAFGAPQAASMPAMEGKIKRAVAPVVAPFDLADVRLLPGLFLDAQKRDEKYLLSLEPDRMLTNFRKNAGLEPKALVYGGWESVQPWIDIRCHGHTLGHYLTACALMYASTGTEEYKKRCDYIVAELKECQTAGKTGLICAFPDNAAPFEAMAAGRNFPGVIWYTMHKIFAGLRDAYLFAKSADALAIAAKLADFSIATTEKLTDAQFQRMLGVEHGGMNEILGDIYVLTGEEKYLTLAERFCHRQVMDPLAQGRDTLGTLHSNTQIPKFIGFERLHELTGKAEYLAAAKFFWQTVTRTRSFATGGNGDNEHFFPITDFARHISSAKTMETCCSHNMMRLSRALFTLEPRAEYGDYYERALYNTILASQDPDSGMFTYFQPLRPGYVKIFCTPTDSFWCCTGTGMENHAKYGDSIYFHGTGSRGEAALYVNLFISSMLTWKQKGLTITQTTTFPETGKTTLSIKADVPVEVTLKIRQPYWCKAMTARVTRIEESPNLYRAEGDSGYLSVTRTWKTGDSVEIDLPMALHGQLLPGTTDTVAVMYGPLALAGKLGKQGITPGSDIIINERTIGTMLNDQIDVPTLAGEGVKVVEGIKPGAEPLTFVAPALARPEGVTLVPYYRIAHERYSLYWKVAKN